MNQQVLVEMSYFIHFFRCSKKMSTPKYYYTKLLAIYRKTWIVLGRWRWQTPGINHPNISEAINLSKASCIPSAPIIILLMKQRSNAAWPFRTLESNSENTHVMSLQKGILFLRRYLESYNLTRKLSYWVLPTFFNVSSFLCVKVCTVVRYLICMYRAYDLDQKNAGSYAPDKFFNQILFANTQCMVYLPTFG